MLEFTVRFQYEKSTKNTFRYKEVKQYGQSPIIGTIYVQKYMFPYTPNIPSDFLDVRVIQINKPTI